MGIIKEVTIGDCRLILGDCLTVMPLLDKVDCVFSDPPYHGVKRDGWDNQWKTDVDFLEWVRKVSGLMQSLLASNGSLYWFASPQMASRVEVTISETLSIVNNLVWDKGASRQGAGGTGIDVTALRSYWTASTERIVFAEQYGADKSAIDESGYLTACETAKSSIFGDYFKAEFQRAGVTNKTIAALFPSKTGKVTGCVSNWILGLNVPTKDQYLKIRAHLNIDNDEYLKREYEDLKREYEDLRRPFFLTPNGEWGDVWKFKIDRNQQHPTQKPLELMRHIVEASSRSQMTILDPFMGSGTTGVACAKLGRKFIGIELEEKYFDIACKRIKEAYSQPDLFIEPPTQPTQETMI